MIRNIAKSLWSAGILVSGQGLRVDVWCLLTYQDTGLAFGYCATPGRKSLHQQKVLTSLVLPNQQPYIVMKVIKNLHDAGFCLSI
jgi:hypothetical protein